MYVGVSKGKNMLHWRFPFMIFGLVLMMGDVRSMEQRAPGDTSDWK